MCEYNRMQRKYRLRYTCVCVYVCAYNINPKIVIIHNSKPCRIKKFYSYAKSIFENIGK